ncbi:MAG: hypothetical protein V7603_3364 [Micromonosporaceae bacterium]
MLQRVKRGIALAAAGLAVLTVAGSPAVGGPLPDPAVDPDGNLVANASFEVGDAAKHPVGWVISGAPSAQSAAVSGTAANVRTGHASLQIVDPSDNNVTVRSENVSGHAGVTYAAKAWVKGGSGTSAWLYLEAWDATGTRVGVTSAAPAFSTSWQQVSLSLAAPAGTVHVTVAVYGSVTTSGTSYYDDVSLTASAPAYNPAIGPARELFLDDYRIESATNVGRLVHPATKRSTPVIVADKPWESTVYIYGSVVTGSPGAAYKMWYTAYNTDFGTYLLCYATSTDGITWTKPSLGKVDFNGSTANNIVNKLGGTVLYDPASAAGRQYKLLTYVSSPQGYYAYFSGDGITWTASTHNPVLPYGDVSNVVFDAARGRYIATTKQRTVDIATTPGTNDRMAYVSTSTDFETWSVPALAVEGDYRDDEAARGAGGLEMQIYGMPVYPYESTYLGLPWMFDVDNYTEGGYAPAGDGPIVPQLASSRDLVQWSRPARTPVLPLGEAGAWDDSMIFTSTTMQIGTGTVSMYYGGFNVGHGGGAGQRASIGLATWRRDGFESLHNAGDDPGTVVTRPITFTGDTLHLNTMVAAGGSVTVAVLNSSGTPVAQSAPITGDQLDATVSWTSGASLSSLAGQQVKLRFSVDGADLYSYWVTPAS